MSKPGDMKSALVVAGVFVCIWLVLGSHMIAPDKDFLNLYTGAAMARSGAFTELHNYEAQLSLEKKLAPAAGSFGPFMRPSFYAAILSPLALLPFSQAFVLWLLLNAAIFAVCIGWATRRFGPEALVFASLFLPAALGIAHGQDCVLMLAVAAGAFAVAESGSMFAAGAVLALGLFKFHLLLLVPLVLLVRREWRMLAGFAASGSLLAAVSVALSGLGPYWHLLFRKDLEDLRSPSPYLFVNVYSLVHNFADQTHPILMAALAALVLALTLAAACRSPLWLWFSAALTGSLLVAPHALGYDAAMLLLPIWASISLARKKTLRLTAAAAALPVPFFLGLHGPPWSATPALAVLLLLCALAWDASAIRLAPGLRLAGPPAAEADHLTVAK